MHPEMQGHTHKTQKVTPNMPVTSPNTKLVTHPVPNHQKGHTNRPPTPQMSHAPSPTTKKSHNAVPKHQKTSQRRPQTPQKVTPNTHLRLPNRAFLCTNNHTRYMFGTRSWTMWAVVWCMRACLCVCCVVGGGDMWVGMAGGGCESTGRLCGCEWGVPHMRG